MEKFNDGYYDPPEEDETCQICHHGPGNCTCPECVCGETGNPACINKHMEWKKWGHFNFQLSKAELKAELEAERKQAEQEAIWEKELENREVEMEFPLCEHEGYNDKEICGDCGQRIAGPFEAVFFDDGDPNIPSGPIYDFRGGTEPE